MIDQLLTTYADLMEKLETLPDEIGDAKREEIRVIESNGGFKELGTNDKERAHKLLMLLTSHMPVTASDLERRYDGVAHQARLHAALLNYLASAGTPVRLPEFMPPMQFSANGHSTNGAPTVSDAEAIGL